MLVKLFGIFVFLLLSQQAMTQGLPGCLNHKGEVVDWFLIYYTPKRVHDHTPLYGYMYKDSNSNTSYFDIYPGWGDEDNGPLGMTIAQVQQHKMESIAWNDQLYPHQGSGNSNKAHAKFFMSLKSKAYGFAMSHSTPKFPTINDEGDFT